HASLVVLAQAEAVVRARREQKDGREGRRDEGDEEDVAIELAESREAVGKGHRQQEGEEDLYAGQRDPQLVQELDQLPVAPLFVALGHGHLLPPCSGLKGDSPIRSPWSPRVTTSLRACCRSSCRSASGSSCREMSADACRRRTSRS